EVGVGEVDVLGALFGDGDGSCGDVTLGLESETTGDGLPAGLGDGELEAEVLCDGLHQLHVEARVLAVLDELHGRVGDVGADRERARGLELELGPAASGGSCSFARTIATGGDDQRQYGDGGEEPCSVLHQLMSSMIGVGQLPTGQG